MAEARVKPNMLPLPVTNKVQETVYDTIDYKLPFNMLIEYNAKDLPIKIDISESLYGVLEGESLFQGEVLNLYFLKETDAVIANCKSVSLADRAAIPIWSSHQLNIGWCTDSCLAICSYSSLMKSLSSSYLPKVARVEEGAGYLKTGEVLLFTANCKGAKYKSGKVASIVCWSITNQKVKKLGNKCQKATFSVAPEHTKVYLRDIIDHCQLPVAIQIYNITGRSTSIKLTISQRLTVKSVIASKESKPNELLEVLISSCDIMAQRLEISEGHLEQLQKITKHVYKAFHPSQVSKIIESLSACYTPYRTDMFTSVLDEWKSSIQLIPPSLPLHIIPQMPKKDPLMISPKPQKINQHEYKVPETPTTPELPPLPCMNPSDIQSDGSTSVKCHTSLLPRGENTNESMQQLYDQEMDVSEKSAEEYYTATISTPTLGRSKIYYEENCNTLNQFTTNQVLDLLDALKLSQYKVTFGNEEVNGNLFLELDEQILEELGVESRLHQIKLMQVVRGTKPVPMV